MRHMRIFLAGDSSVTSRPQSMAPMVGWGQVLQMFIRYAEVINAARAGSSSRSFKERGRLDWILENIAPGDLLLVSFGLIDMKPGDGRFTEPFGDYQWFLRQYVHGARDRGAHPVFVTSHERRVFDDHGNMRRPLGLYPTAMRELAMSLNVPFLDLNAWSVDWWRRAGAQGTKELFLYLEAGEHPNYPDGIADNTHLRAHGALECARFVARRLRAQALLTPEYFRNLDEPIPESAVEFLDDHVFEQLTKERVGGRTAAQESGTLR
ncbi:rhamnogalacturonan acetylesterase [Streptomyces sp. V3I7]|uniref:rhamnogalacturonan acetylesterase n=1 Tax=Streptomyces sp. V3I7 TaxID=3042278 RepID=UPI002785E39A|nr:rhamnogalacturonan acetylesterase [Streptomyces sp. V3I7]MDQ0993631.1 lysophospholipase L1-like esterase [Streptomyces sp. V3I7]